MDNTGPLPDGWWREEPLEKKIGKKILHPGSHGSTHWYIDPHSGEVVYGDRPHPIIPIPKADHSIKNPVALTAEDHVLDILNDIGFLDNRQLVAQPVHTEIVVRKHAAKAMEQRGFDSQEFKTAWDAVMAHLHVTGGYKTIKWNKDTLDGRIQAWLQNHKVSSHNVADAIAHMPKEMRHKMADDIAEDVPVFSWDHENGAAEQAKVRKEALERIMELRYHLNYEETPEGPAPVQHAIKLSKDDEVSEILGGFQEYAHARAIHDYLEGTDKFNDVPKDLLPLALGMDKDLARLLSDMSPRAYKMLHPLYQHQLNLRDAKNLSYLAHDDLGGFPLEMKMLWDMLEKEGDLSEAGDILTPQKIKDYLQDKYGYTPLSADLRGARNAWETVSHSLSRAGMEDLAEAINEAWKKPAIAPQAVGQFPISADIEPGDEDDAEDLFNEFNREIADLDYDGGGASQDDIDEMAEQYFDDNYQEIMRERVQEYRRENQDDFDRILLRLAEEYAAENMKIEDFMDDSGDEDRAHALMVASAESEVEDLAEDEFREQAENDLEDEVREAANDISQEQAQQYYDENGGGGDMEDRVKAKIDIMNTLGSIMQERHGVTVDDCRAFFRTISEEPNDEFTANAVGLHEYVAGATAHLVECWAGSSDGHNSVSNAMQMLVSDLFPDVPRWDEAPDHMDQDAFRLAKGFVNDPKFRAVAEPFLRSMYEHTQERFKEAGVEHVVIARGIKDGHGDQIQDAINAGIVAFGNDTANQGQGGFITGTHPIIDNPMSSWSWSASTSEGFASRSSVVFAAKVPIERVIGTFRTGYGCMDEEEAVVLGGGGLARWYYIHGSGSGSRDNRPQIVNRAMGGDPLTVEPVQVSDYNDYKLKAIYKPGRIYDANQGKMVQGVLPEHLVSHNKAAEEHNAKYHQKKADAAVKAEEIMKDVGVDLSTHPGMKTYLSNVVHQITDDNHAYNEQTKNSLTGHGATKEQAEKLYDKIVSLTKNDTTPETQMHHIAMHGNLSKEQAKEVYEYLTPFKNAPPSAQNHEGYATQHIQGLINKFAMGGYAATSIINHIQATPGMFKDNDYKPTLPPKVPKTKVPKIPKTDSSGQVVQPAAPASKTLSTQSKISLFMASGGVSKVSAEAAHQALKTFMASDPAKQQDKSNQNKQIEDLVKYEGLTKYQATQIVSLIKDKPELFKDGPAVQQGTAPGSNPMSPHEAQVQFIATHTGVSQAAAKQSSEAMSKFKQATPELQKDKGYQASYVKHLIQEHSFTNEQGVKLVKLYADFPDVFKSAAVEGSSRLQKALAWTADLARRLGH